MSRRELLSVGLAALLVLSVVVGITLHSLTQDGPSGRTTPGHIVAPRQEPTRTFHAVTVLPGPLTKLGAEVRVLGARAIAAVPAALRPAITGIGVGGLIRQNTHASCYLNASATARRCTVIIRAGIKPWGEFEFRVDSSGTHYLSVSYWA